jgi:hypothetical protein
MTARDDADAIGRLRAAARRWSCRTTYAWLQPGPSDFLTAWSLVFPMIGPRTAELRT